MEKRKKLGKRRNISNYVITALVVAFVFFPIYIIIDTSLQSESEANLATFHWIPQEFTLRGYISVFTKKLAGISIMEGLFNTLWIYLPGVTVGIYTSAMAAFAFAKMRFAAKNIMFSILLATIMLPNSMSTIAQVILYDSLGWINTPWPLMIPRMFGGIATVFFMKQFYSKIPNDLIDAAKVSGLGFFGIFHRIVFPLSGTVITAQFILNFIAAYNDYLGPLLYCQASSMYTLQVALAMFAGPYAQNWPLRMAGSFVGMAPLVILYVCSQKSIRKGLDISASIKG